MKRYPLALIIMMMSLVSFAQIRSSLSFNNTKVVKEKGLFNAPDPDKTLNIQIDRDKEANVALFPNPSTDELTVQIEGNDQYQISLMDRMGRVLSSTITERESGKASIDVSKFQKGIYYVKVHGKDFNEIRRIAIE